MMTQNCSLVENYYEAVKEKDVQKALSFVHQEIQFKSPMGEVQGLDSFKEIFKDFVEHQAGIEIKTKMESNQEVLMTYEVKFKKPSKNLPTAGYFVIKDHLIYKIRLYFDPSVLSFDPSYTKQSA